MGLQAGAMYGCIVRCEKETETYRGESIHLESQAVVRQFLEASRRGSSAPAVTSPVTVCFPVSSETLMIARRKRTSIVNLVSACSLSVFRRSLCGLYITLSVL